MNINRDALLIYLRDLRDLELAKYRLSEMIVEEEYNFETTDASLQESHYKPYYAEDTRSTNDVYISTHAGWAFLEILLCIACTVLDIYLITQMRSPVGWIVVIFFAIVALISGFCGIANIQEYGTEKRDFENKKIEIAKHQEAIRKANEKVRQYNEQEEKRVHNNQQLRVQYAEEWAQRKSYLQNESEKVDGLLDESYSLNILPSPYRNIQSVYYIYEYMSTSQASFDETLMHEHLENGFERILDRLDTIVSNQGIQIFHLRAIEAQNQRQIEQTQNVLHQLDEMDRNNQAALSKMQSSLNAIQESSEQTFQYAEISARYTAATAYFSLADYLKKN